MIQKKKTTQIETMTWQRNHLAYKKPGRMNECRMNFFLFVTVSLLYCLCDQEVSTSTVSTTLLVGIHQVDRECHQKTHHCFGVLVLFSLAPGLLG